MGRVLSSILVLLAVAFGSNAQVIGIPSSSSTPPSPTPPPVPVGVEIHPNGQPNKCVEVRGGVFANGTPVQVYDCNGTAAQKWTFTRNQVQAQIRLAGTNFCLDAGDNPFQPNGNQMKIWDCYPTLTQQRWYVADDGTIKLSDVRYGQFGVCLDLTDGRLDNTNVLQTWECSANNNNQVWQSGQVISSSPIPIPPTSTTPSGPIITQPPTSTDDYPKPGCPVFSCAACPPSYTVTFIAPQPTLCHACACVSTPAASPTAPFPTPGGEYPRPGCPTYSCPACRPGTSPTFVANGPDACHACACIERAFSVPTSAP